MNSPFARATRRSNQFQGESSFRFKKKKVHGGFDSVSLGTGHRKKG
jgi:hypothetical protein